MRTGTERRLRRDVARRAGCESDGYEVDSWCAYCNLPLTIVWEPGAEPEFITRDGDVAHLDHVIPECRNGPTSLDNTVVACPTCNMAKGASAFGDPGFITYIAERRAWIVAGVRV